MSNLVGFRSDRSVSKLSLEWSVVVYVWGVVFWGEGVFWSCRSVSRIVFESILGSFIALVMMVCFMLILVWWYSFQIWRGLFFCIFDDWHRRMFLLDDDTQKSMEEWKGCS